MLSLFLFLFFCLVIINCNHNTVLQGFNFFSRNTDEIAIKKTNNDYYCVYLNCSHLLYCSTHIFISIIYMQYKCSVKWCKYQFTNTCTEIYVSHVLCLLGQVHTESIVLEKMFTFKQSN